MTKDIQFKPTFKDRYPGSGMACHAKSGTVHRKNFVLTPTLAEVMERVVASKLSPSRKRDCVSAVRKYAALMGQTPEMVPAVLSDIRARLDALPPTSSTKAKTASNFRSNLFTAIGTAEPTRVLRTASVRLNPAWDRMQGALQSPRLRIGLSRFMRYCSANDIAPTDVSAAVHASFKEALRDQTTARNIARLGRQTATLWNEAVAANPSFGLITIAIPRKSTDFKGLLPLEVFPPTFLKDLEHHLSNAASVDIWGAGERSRPLRPTSIRMRQFYIRKAATTLVQSGIEATSITDLAYLCAPESLKRILSQWGVRPGDPCSEYQRGTVRALVSVAREHVISSDLDRTKLTNIMRQIGPNRRAFADKNKILLRHVNDPLNLSELLDLPHRLMREFKKKPRASQNLFDAQRFIALLILLRAPLRVANLRALEFEKNLFLPGRTGLEAYIEIPREDMKNGEPFAISLPAEIADLLRWYRDDFLRQKLRVSPRYVFCNNKGDRRPTTSVAAMIRNSTRRYLGFKMTAHQFRHLAAKIILDANPGNYELVRQLLGHKNMATTVAFYTGIDTIRVGRLHSELIRKLQETTQVGRPTKSRIGLEDR